MIESTTYKFAKALKKRFGGDVFEKLDGKDRFYITNSYHIPVFEPIDAFDKLEIESKFQKLSPGGCFNILNSYPKLCERFTQAVYRKMLTGDNRKINPVPSYYQVEGVQTNCSAEYGTARSAQRVKW